MLALALLFLPAAVFSQQGGRAAGEGAAVPSVSALEIAVKGSLIRLTWKDAPDARGPVYIYRSAAPFTGVQPGLGKTPPLKVPYGVEYYIDEAETTGRIHYFVVPSDESGRSYEPPPSAGNSGTVDISGLPFLELLSVSEDPEPSGAHGGIYALEARARGEGVNISFLTTFSDRNLVLYRSVQPITRAADLLNAVIVQSGRLSSPFTDYPVPGIQYYYAVIFEDELTRGSARIYPDHNATQRPVEIKTGTGRVGLPRAKGEIRSVPPTSLNYAALGLESLVETPAKSASLSPAARQALESLAPKPRYRPKQRPRAFSQDLSDQEAAGEEGVLKAIVRDYFIGGDWENSRLELQRCLSQHHSADIAARARFYLAQALYFSGSYREALREFLLVKDFHPQEANAWISATLSALIE